LRLYSYVVDHDLGYAPNPNDGICTLVQCKYSKSKRKNIIEMADVGDWIIGTGGKSNQSAGAGKIIYLMRVDNKISLLKYHGNRNFKDRKDREPLIPQNGRFALISTTYFYFGKNEHQNGVRSLNVSFTKWLRQ
jgi:hypothetical protein